MDVKCLELSSALTKRAVVKLSRLRRKHKNRINSFEGRCMAMCVYVPVYSRTLTRKGWVVNLFKNLFGHDISFDKFLALLMLIIFLTKRQCRVFHQVLQATIPASFSHVCNLKMKQHITVCSLLFGNRSKGPIPGSAWILLICCANLFFFLSLRNFFLQSLWRLSHSLHPSRLAYSWEGDENW